VWLSLIIVFAQYIFLIVKIINTLREIVNKKKVDGHGQVKLIQNIRHDERSPLP
jgi:large-conductance mechanosensitive channel